MTSRKPRDRYTELKNLTAVLNAAITDREKARFADEIIAAQGKILAVILEIRKESGYIAGLDPNDRKIQVLLDALKEIPKGKAPAADVDRLAARLAGVIADAAQTAPNSQVNALKAPPAIETPDKPGPSESVPEAGPGPTATQNLQSTRTAETDDMPRGGQLDESGEDTGTGAREAVPTVQGTLTEETTQAERAIPANRTQADRPTVILGTAGHPTGRSTEYVFAADPTIQKLVDENPALFPQVSLVAHFQKAQAEAEVAFRQREMTGRWEAWSGIHPWDETPEVETTDCPWWVASGEYVFRLADVWRKYSPGKPEHVEKLLAKQVALAAGWVYWNRVFVHDGVNSKNPKVDDLFGDKNAQRFGNFAFLFVMRKFAEQDLDEWKDRAALLEGTVAELEARRSNQFASQPPAGVSEPVSKLKVQEGRDKSNITPAPREKRGRSTRPAEQAPPVPTSTCKTDKGNREILYANGQLKRAVTLDVARRFGGVSRRAIDEAARKGSLKTEGGHLQRKVLVDSLLKYFPPEE